MTKRYIIQNAFNKSIIKDYEITPKNIVPSWWCNKN